MTEASGLILTFAVGKAALEIFMSLIGATDLGRALRAVCLLRAGRGARLGDLAKAGLNHARAVKKGTRVTRRSERSS